MLKAKNIDARFLAILLIKPKSLSKAEATRLVRGVKFAEVADWFITYVVKKHPDHGGLGEEWIQTDQPMAALAGWKLTYQRLQKSSDGLDLSALLDRIESEAESAAPETQWTMNFALAEIGIHYPKHRKRALAIGEKLGLYRDWPTVKGCTSPYVPTWVSEMVSRQS